MNKIFLTLIVFIALSTQSSAHVNLLTPVGGETYTSGDMVTLQWQIAISHNLLNWDLYYSADGGTNWDPIELNIPSTGNAVGTVVTYDWLVPSSATSQGRIWIVMDNSAVDYDDESGDFMINLATGIADNSKERVFELFPNPVSSGSDLNLSFNSAEVTFNSIEIRDLSGALVKTIFTKGSSVSDGMRVDLAGLRSGYFFLCLLGDDRTMIDKRAFVLF